MQAQMALRDKAVLSLIDLVEDDAPAPLVNSEVQQRLQDLSMRLSAQGISAEDYLAGTGKTAESLVHELEELAVQAVKADLALRALADAEDIEVTEEDLDAEIANLAERVGQKPDRVRRELERAEQVQAVRSDIRKRKALEWLVEHVELIDESGQPIERDALTLPEQTHRDDSLEEQSNSAPTDTDDSGLEEEE
jgi:trigger factor